MNIVDSSGWLEFFVDGPNATKFAGPLKETDKLIVPSICMYEVFKLVLRERGEHQALQAVAVMQKGTVIDLNPRVAMTAARLSIAHSLPMADSVILATARITDAVIWTQDADFKGLDCVKYFEKK
ncbi:MAG: type II toxin-antitoxin system VapC family toxin [Kiritimatiellae bacterium]|nr:type II toxin-antitoxin system VapC family toxin [Kiritimatiellia bacterium]MCO5061792.1 type II toxin-antitoxin system VapC family toxin [Kiritimatiellia bacterium]MCO5069312.1 type II toxin-antitoxin system VapC family toxin [Kiritimatiellia bacterium]